MDLWHAGALGVVEAQGLAASIVAVDVMTKAADVKVIGVRRVGGGLVAVSFIGDMASVTAAIDSARRAAAAAGGTLTSTVIGRPAVPASLLRDDTAGERPAGGAASGARAKPRPARGPAARRGTPRAPVSDAAPAEAEPPAEPPTDRARGE
ncbi:hypothetical protein GCM10017673_19400 [Streptosporangium violaceochromogenes]|nr:hypothetical protein GCM10017673_19400 [Streptosporangium violaceochromogenes]